MAGAIELNLSDEMKAALKAGEKGKLALSVIRLARAAMQNAAIEKRHPLSDGEALEVIAREAKQRREAAEEYGRLGRPEVVERFQAEIAILERYLPRQLPEDEIRRLVAEAIAAVGATSKRDLGKVMSMVMSQTRGRADGRKVSELVISLLPDA